MNATRIEKLREILKNKMIPMELNSKFIFNHIEIAAAENIIVYTRIFRSIKRRCFLLLPLYLHSLY